MNEKTVKTLGIATAVAVVGAIAFNALRDRSTAASGTDERLVPELEDRINDVRTVVVEGSQGTMTLEGEGDDWTMAEKNGYPARAEKVREVLLAFREARKFEEKTSDPEKFERLGLQPPGEEGSRSTRLTLRDGKGDTIASVLVGNRRTGKAVGADLPEGVRPDEQYYVLPGEDGPTWLAIGNLRVDSYVSAWMDQQFLDVPRDRIKAVRITHPDGETLAAVREEMDANEMAVLDVPEGMQPKTPSGTGQLLNALARLRFDDVQKQSELDWSSSPLTKAEYFTEHGLRVTVETMELPKEDDPDQKVAWARLRFDVAPDEAPTLPEPEPIVGPLPPEDDDAAAAEDDEAGDEDASEDVEDGEGDEDDGPSLEELVDEAEELAESVGDWAYALPTWKTTAFRMRSDAVLEPVPEPEPEDLEGSEGSGDVDVDAAGDDLPQDDSAGGGDGSDDATTGDG